MVLKGDGDGKKIVACSVGFQRLHSIDTKESVTRVFRIFTLYEETNAKEPRNESFFNSKINVSEQTKEKWRRELETIVH